MLIILSESIRGLGKFGEVVKVKPGYARNFLFPQGKAARATKENLAKLEKQRLLLEKEDTKKLNSAVELASLLSNKFVVLVKQASEDGKIFGSVTTREVAKALSHEGFTIDHRSIFLNIADIKKIGEYVASIELHSDVLVSVTIHIVKSEADACKLKEVKVHSDNDGINKIDASTEEETV